MKICVLLRSENDTTGTYETNAAPDLPSYIDANTHDTDTRYISKDKGIEEIDQLVGQGFDLCINYLFQNNATITEWIEIGKHLSLSTLPCIGALPISTLGQLSDVTGNMTNPDTMKATSEGPAESTPDMEGQSSTAQLSVYTNETQICEGDFSVLVVLIGRTGEALVPIERKHLDINSTEIESVATEEPQWQLVQDPSLVACLKLTATQAFDSYRGSEYLAYMRIDLQLDGTTGQVHAIRADPAPAIFYKRGTNPLDDLIIAKTFPGGHAAFFEVIISSKLAREPDFARRNQGCANQHDKDAGNYHKILAIGALTNRVSPLIGKYDFEGTVLDCCSGSGGFARYAVDNGVKARFSGADYSVEMIKLPDCQALYEKPILIGPIQETLMQASMHDHVVCFGSLHLFRSFDFVSALSQFFLRARKSVTFDVDNLSQTYIQGSAKAAGEKPEEKLDYNHNNVEAALRFGTPLGWKAVIYNEERLAYHSPLMKEDVYTRTYRFERI
ncbi:hypothetical protein F4808DRAFT_379442 [Astrocystis sublimbata]|nr:hypothetical protein F4808DRAFT_379442 [Astrocystis sublimbata]